VHIKELDHNRVGKKTYNHPKMVEWRTWSPNFTLSVPRALTLCPQILELHQKDLNNPMPKRHEIPWLYVQENNDLTKTTRTDPSLVQETQAHAQEAWNTLTLCSRNLWPQLKYQNWPILSPKNSSPCPRGLSHLLYMLRKPKFLKSKRIMLIKYQNGHATS
jgi:hypothetical protein